MTQLTVKENKVIAALPAQIQPIVAARFGQPIRSYDDVDLAIQIKNLLLRTYFELGLNINDKDAVLSQQREILLRDFRARKYEHISVELIQLFVSNGVRGEYGTFNGQLNTVNIQNIHHWVNHGLKSEEYKRSVTEFNQRLEEEEVKTSKQPVMYTKAHLKILSVQAFNEYTAGGNIPIPSAAATFYDTIKEIMKVDSLISKSDWKSVYNEAKNNYTTAQKALKRERDRKDIKLDFTLATEEKPGNKSFENHIKRVGLRYFFDQLIKENKDLDSLLSKGEGEDLAL